MREQVVVAVPVEVANDRPIGRSERRRGRASGEVGAQDRSVRAEHQRFEVRSPVPAVAMAHGATPSVERAEELPVGARDDGQCAGADHRRAGRDPRVVRRGLRARTGRAGAGGVPDCVVGAVPVPARVEERVAAGVVDQLGLFDQGAFPSGVDVEDRGRPSHQPGSVGGQRLCPQSRGLADAVLVALPVEPERPVDVDERTRIDASPEVGLTQQRRLGFVDVGAFGSRRRGMADALHAEFWIVCRVVERPRSVGFDPHHARCPRESGERPSSDGGEGVGGRRPRGQVGRAPVRDVAIDSVGPEEVPEPRLRIPYQFRVRDIGLDHRRTDHRRTGVGVGVRRRGERDDRDSDGSEQRNDPPTRSRPRCHRSTPTMSRAARLRPKQRTARTGQFRQAY